jgi:hypothetical protein
MLRRVALVRTDVSEELSVSIIIVTRIGEVGTTLAITINRRTLRRNTIHVTVIMDVLRSSKTLVLTRATRRNIPEDSIFHSLCRENHKSYTILTLFEALNRRLSEGQEIIVNIIMIVDDPTAM